MFPRHSWAVCVFVLLCCGGCNDNPTSPIVSPPPPPPPPPLADVSGNWTATIHYEYPDDWCACCFPDYKASATFTQNGSDVSGSIRSECIVEQFKGTLQRGALTGTVKVSSGDATFDGLASGSATTTGFSLTTKDLQNGGHGTSGYTMAFSR